MKLIVILLYCYLVVFPFGQLTRLPLDIAEVNLYLTDILVGGLLLTWLGWKLLKKDQFHRPPLVSPILLFFVLALISLILNTSLLSGREVGVGFLYLIRWLVYAGLYFVVYDLVHSSKQNFFNLLIGAGFITAVLGLLQYFFLPDTRFLEALGWDPHYYRVIGTFLDPGFLGMILVFTLILLTHKIWPLKKSSSLEVIVWITLYLALALTYSRASYLAYLMGIGVIAWFKKSPKFFLAVFVAGVMTVLLLPRPGGEGVKLERSSTIEARITSWRQSLTIAKENPVFGVGFNAYRYAQTRHGFLAEQGGQISHAGAGADSSWLFVLATTGIAGMAAYLWLWMKIFKTGNLLIFASAAALAVHAWFLNSLFYPWIMAWFWILLGAVKTKD